MIVSRDDDEAVLHGEVAVPPADGQLPPPRADQLGPAVARLVAVSRPPETETFRATLTAGLGQAKISSQT